MMAADSLKGSRLEDDNHPKTCKRQGRNRKDAKRVNNRAADPAELGRPCVQSRRKAKGRKRKVYLASAERT